jgi:hypothetical protein
MDDELRTAKKRSSSKPKANESLSSIPKFDTQNVSSSALARPQITRVTGLTAQNTFPQNLSHLSPLKQAVIMAEVLGPPKASQ